MDKAKLSFISSQDNKTTIIKRNIAIVIINVNKKDDIT
jgi:hypothetical protein